MDERWSSALMCVMGCGDWMVGRDDNSRGVSTDGCGEWYIVPTDYTFEYLSDEHR